MVSALLVCHIICTHQLPIVKFEQAWTKLLEQRFNKTITTSVNVLLSKNQIFDFDT
jgi:hypothetical protein